MFLVNSRFPLVCATPVSSGSKCHHHIRVLFIPKLHRYFAEFLNHSSPTRLGLLDLSTCVGLGYGRHENSLEAFLGSIGSVTSPKRLGVTSQPSRDSDLPKPRPTRLPQDNQRLGSHTFLRHPIANRLVVGRFALRREQPLSNNKLVRTRSRRYWNINQLCIDYASRPRLSSRLTLGGRTFPRNPWTFGGGDSHSSFATHANIRTRQQSTTSSPAASTRNRRSATTHNKVVHPQIRLWT